MDLNAVLHLLVDVNACCYRATLDFALAKGRGHHGEFPNTGLVSLGPSMKQDVEVVLLTANCLYLQVSLSPLLAEKRVTGHVLASLGLMPPPRRSKVLSYDSIEEWCNLWYNISVVGLAMLLTVLDRLRRQVTTVRELSEHVAALLQLLEKQCSLAHLISTRPDVVATCMHRWAFSTLSLLLEAVTVVPRNESEGTACGSRKPSVSAEDSFTMLWTEFVSRPATTAAASPGSFADATPTSAINASSSVDDIENHSVATLLRCCTSLLSNCAFLSSSAFSLPVSANVSSVSGGSGKHKKPKNRLAKSANQTVSRAYLSTSFVGSLLGIIPQFVRAQIYDSMSSLRELKAIAPLLSPATNIFLPRPAGRPSIALAPLLRSLKGALSDGKLPQRHHHGGAMEVMHVMGTAEAQLHIVMYDVRSLLSGWASREADSTVKDTNDSMQHRQISNNEREGFRHVWMAAAADSLMRLRPFPWQRDTGVVTRAETIDWSQAAEDTTKHIHVIENALSAGAPSRPENSELATRSALCDLYGGAWRVTVSYLKLLEFDFNIRQPLRPVLPGRASLQTSEKSSVASRLREEGDEAANAIERRHQLARDVLKWLLRCGEWEAGRALCQVLLEGYQRALLSPDTAAPTPLLQAVPVPTLLPPTIASSIVSTLQTHGTQLQSPLPPRIRTCDLDCLQKQALGSERLQTLCRELARATDTYDDRLLHDGATRCLPVHYAVRFMCSPWGQAGSGPVGREAPEDDALRELAASCGCSFVCVLPTPSPAENREEGQAGLLHADLDAAVGISGQETWLLLRYDCAAFSWNEADEEAGGGGGLATRRYVEQLESRGGPLGSYSRLIHQVAKAFPDFCLKSSSTLHALDRTHSPRAAADTTPFTKVVQVFEAFPNLADQAPVPPEPVASPLGADLTHHVYPRENVTMFANSECHSSAFAAAVLVGVGEERGADRKVALANHLSATVRRSNLSSPQCAIFSTFPQVEGAGVNRAFHFSDPPVPAFSVPHRSEGKVLSRWQHHADCSTFLVHTCLHPSRCPSDRSSDSYFTTTLVLSTAGVGGREADRAPFESGKGPLNTDDCSLLISGHLLQRAPAQLAVVSSAVVLPSLVTQGFCVLRSQLLRLKHCEDLLVHLGDTAADALKRSDNDISSFSTTVKYVVACVSNCVARSQHEGNNSSNTIMGIHNAAAMICGEVERRDLLWQRARRTIKHDHVSRKAAFDQWVKDAKAGGQSGAPPPCPSELDVATLEEAFVSSLQAVDTIHLATLLGVSAARLPERLEAAAASLLDPATYSPSPSQVPEEVSIETRQLSVLQLVTLMQQQTITTTQRVLVLLRKCVEFLPDTDSVSLPRRDTPETDSDVSTESEGGSVDVNARGDTEDKPSGSTRQGWLLVLRWLEHSCFSQNV